MASSKNIPIARRLFEEVYSGKNFDSCDQYIVSDMHFYDPAAPNFRGGLQAFKERERAYARAFPDKSVNIDEIFEAGNKVVIRWTVNGTHKGNLPGISATGNRIHVTGIVILEFEDGRIANIWQTWDRLGLLEQLDQVQHKAVEALC